MDDSIVAVVKKFQKDNKFYIFGVFDIIMQKKLNEKFLEFVKFKYVDKQFEWVIQYFKIGK